MTLPIRKRLVITGSGGSVGRELVDELVSDHDLVLIDRKGGAGVINADLSDRRIWHRVSRRLGRKPRWEAAFAGADAIIHLAADPDPEGGYRSIIWNNIAGTHNVLEAARRMEVPKVIYASTLLAFIGHVAGNLHALMESNVGTVDEDSTFFPITMYGHSKAVGELAGRAAVAMGHLRSFVAVRIGGFRLEEPTRPVYRTRWVGREDLRRVFRACVEKPLDGFHAVYAMSPHPDLPVDLSGTNTLLFE